MGTVETPQAFVVVHEAMVPVEPEVERDTIHAKEDRQAQPVELDRCLGGGVGEDDGHDNAASNGDDEGEHDFGSAMVGDIVAFLLAVEETVAVGHPPHDVELVDASQSQGQGIADDDNDGMDRAAGKVVEVGLVYG